jgi:hypothetical protein
MKKIIILLASILVMSILLAVAIDSEVFVSGGTQVTQPLEAKLGSETYPVTEMAGTTVSAKSFTLYNRFPVPASINAAYSISPSTGLAISLPALPITILPNSSTDVWATYYGAEPGNYTVTYQLSADIDSKAYVNPGSQAVNSSAHVELEFYVPVEVTAPPEEPEESES